MYVCLRGAHLLSLEMVKVLLLRVSLVREENLKLALKWYIAVLVLINIPSIINMHP